jgi:alpha-glucosidase
VRWFEFSAFCASFRSHGKTWHLRVPWGWNTGDYGTVEDPLKNLPPVSELHNDKVEKICRDILNLRYQLLPYNYSLTREAHDKGLPLMRALWLYYPQDTVAIKQNGEYLWGDQLLVAPVTEQGATTKQVYLPKGDWYNWWTNKKENGGQTINCPADLGTVPLYAKAGAIIPFDPKRQYVDEGVTEATTIRVYKGADGHFTLYDDDGKTQQYLENKGSWTAFDWNERDQQLTIKADGGKPPIARKFNLLFIPGNKKMEVNYTGKNIYINLNKTTRGNAKRGSKPVRFN